MYVHVYTYDGLPTRPLIGYARQGHRNTRTLFPILLHFPSGVFCKGHLRDARGSTRINSPRLQRSACSIEHVDLKIACINSFNIPQVDEHSIVIYNEMLESNHLREFFEIRTRTDRRYSSSTSWAERMVPLVLSELVA